ncbi:MAG: MerR family transcriptional regulator [Anaerovoracaceae bacterium]
MQKKRCDKMEREKEFYSVGEVSQICNISKKALRFYDELNIISPDKVMDNNYRYYSRQTMLMVPVVKYFKQMGFRLNEMREFLDGSAYGVIANAFQDKITELEEEQRLLQMKYQSVKDWYDLILEAQMVIENDIREVSVKYVNASDYCFMDQPYSANYMESIINIEFTNYIEALENEITGPVMICFPSHEKKLAGTLETFRMMQKTLIETDKEHSMVLGGRPMVSCYHIGSHETLGETYEKTFKWAEKHNYRLGEASYERYVTDYWTTGDADQFVTEIMIYVEK